jgi:hypothetical protein
MMLSDSMVDYFCEVLTACTVFDRNRKQCMQLKVDDTFINP